jgi:glycosyltransferase involved in cell wall biosynthesis
MIRIGIDGRLAGADSAGIGRYVTHLLALLPTLTDQVEWVYFFRSQHQADTLLQTLSTTVRPRVTTVTTDIRHYSWQEQLLLPKVFSAAQLDLLHVPHFNVPIFYRGPVVVTIHDLLWHERKGGAVTTLPWWQYWPKYLLYRLVTRLAITRAKSVLVPTKTVAKTITHYFKHAQPKIVVTPEGVADIFYTSKKISPAPAHTHLLYVGSLYPHKNIAVVLRYLKNNPEVHLSIASARSIFHHQTIQLARKLGVNSQVEFLGFVPDEKLLKVFAKTTALVAPSFSEGFGLPGLEAMAAGLPVVASNIPIFKEVYAEAAVYFDPESEIELAAAIQTATQQRDQLITRGRQQAQLYSWSTMVSQTWTTYQKVLND